MSYTCEFASSTDSWAVKDKDPGYKCKKGALLKYEHIRVRTKQRRKATDHAPKKARGALKRHAAEHWSRY